MNREGNGHSNMSKKNGKKKEQNYKNNINENKQISIKE